MLRKAKLFNAIMISLLVGSVYSSKAEQWSVVSPESGGWFTGLVLSDDGKLAVVACDAIGNYIPLNSAESISTSQCIYNYYIQISNGFIRVLNYSYISNQHVYGNWVNLNGSGSSSTTAPLPRPGWITLYYTGIDVSDGRIRFCMSVYPFHLGSYVHCGNWINLKTHKIHTCPSGYSFNSSTNKCEATPTITCPAGYTYNSSIQKCQANPVVSCPTN